MQSDCTCACALACLHPHNSIPNVVESLVIHDNIYIYNIQIIYIFVKVNVFEYVQTDGELSLRSATSGKPWWSCDTDVMLGERGERQTEPCHN